MKQWGATTTNLFIVLAVWVSSSKAMEPITAPVLAVKSKYDRSITTTTAGMMSYEETVVPLTSYADAPLSELERAADDSIFRVLVALPKRLMLVRFDVTIDGKPFPAVRDDRVKEMVADESRESWPARLRKYGDSTGRDIDAKEASWLMRQWGKGTRLMMLSENFERSRAAQSPVRDVLDRNGDGVIDANELSGAVAILRRCDTNQNGVVELEEIQIAASSMVIEKSDWSPPELMIPVRDRGSLSHSFRRLLKYAKQHSAKELVASLSKFDKDRNGSLTEAEYDSIRRVEADLEISVAFNEDEGMATIRNTVGDSNWRMRQEVLATEFYGAKLHFAAVAAGGPSDQISVGIVNDGYPITPFLDQNEDGRLTERELRSVNQRLAILDKNKDKQLTSSELKPVLRLAVGHGLCVQDFLGPVRSNSVEETSIPTQRPTAPDWFASLDKNNDGDLTAKEFVGTKEQFQKLDKDSDGLVSVEEAIP